jgi:histidinol dehydrogenase
MNIFKKVQTIIDRVKSEGDAALYALTQQYDGASLDSLMVELSDLEKAIECVDASLLSAVKIALNRIEYYHAQFKPLNKKVDTGDGMVCEQISRPIERVGLYVPGGTAPLLSTLLMIAVPSNIAGCPLKVLCTPPQADGSIHPALLAVAKLCGIEKIFKIGGAQAIAAMAYGTQTVPKVDKIYGPGNAWVTEAKLLVSQEADGAAIDLPAGPSEVLVIADQFADPRFVAADLLSQAEHDVNAQSILVTDSAMLAQQVNQEIDRQLTHLTRQTIAKVSLKKSSIILVENLKEAFAISNRYAPEHLIVQVKAARTYLPYIKCAGAVFLGPWTPETLGDYVSGSNHVLPTYGYARNYSGLSLKDYFISISVQEATQAGLKSISAAAMLMAETEGLDAHKNAVALRVCDEKI